MAEGFQPFHVPQQSRRDKLRLLEEPLPTYQGSAGLLPHYDSSLLTSHLLTCASPGSHGGTDEPRKSKSSLGFGGLMTTSSLSHFDPLSSLAVNPSSNNSSNQFLYAHQNPRDLDRSFNGGETLSLTRDSTTIICQGLSLSLSSHHRNQNKELDCVAVGGLVVGGGDLPMPNDEFRSVVPLGPFTGYASVLKRSRFLNPAQHLLDDFCGLDRGIYEERRCADLSSMDPPLENLSGTGIVEDPISCSDRIEHQWQNSTLISMLDEVYKRYKLYCQQMQSVVASFETVAGLGNAAPYISFAFKAMSKHFRCMKNAILDQIQFTGKTLADGSIGKDETPRSWRADQGLHCQKPVQNSTFLQHPVWRSQRGLPLRAVLVLRTWLFEHFLHPYPSDSDKQMLAQQTGLSRSQVSNWFINARVRLWKPMVEEIHMLGTQQAQIPSEVENQNANMLTGRLPLANPLPLEKPSPTTLTQETQDSQSKRTRNELPRISEHGEEQVNLFFNNLSSSRHMDAHGSRTGGSSGISLALGLHQSNRIELSQPFPIAMAQHFGLETNSEVHSRNGFEAQNQHFGKDLGGQLLHDFVG